MSTRIFISHSEADEEVSRILVSWLGSALSLTPDAFLCTSSPGSRLAFGRELVGELRDQIESSAAVVALCTKPALRSRWVAFEVGAAWALGKPIFPIIGPGVELIDLPGSLPGYSCLRADDPTALSRAQEFATQLSADIREPIIAGGESIALLDEFLEVLRELYRPSEFPSLSPADSGSGSVPAGDGQRISLQLFERWAEQYGEGFVEGGRQRFRSIWCQHFERGLILYEGNDRWAFVLENLEEKQRRVSAPQARITRRGNRKLNSSVLEKFLSAIPDDERVCYSDLVAQREIVGGIGTIYLRDRLHEILGKPIDEEYRTKDVLMLESARSTLLIGLLEAAEKRAPDVVYELNNDGTFNKFRCE